MITTAYFLLTLSPGEMSHGQMNIPALSELQQS
jgi:hypothetical protein